ncbi:epimerase family protein SDR39U1-like [Bolinopsis microptera]|uniref:epimerase family protein SDR39U1-like n=1 Tax=Bolinopsis microptera TaxID=2820187 RepID=UPI003078D5B1
MAGSVKNIVIGGGTGNIGKYLVSSLIKGGHNVSVISRQAWALNKASKVAPADGARHQMAKNFISWKDIDKDGLPLDTDVVINLSGQSIGKPGPWINSIKKSITSSRIDTTTKLAKAIAKSEAPPKLFISASAVGVYGLDAEKTYTESDPPVAKGKETYFTDLCLKWEESSKLTEECQTRVVNPRFGVVLAYNTDPMRMLLPQGLLFGGTVVGSGEQPFPWIHIDDTVSALEMMIENEEVSGPVNFVAPQIVDNSQFTRALADACMTSVQKITLPALLVRLMYGTERADCILLDSPKVVPQKRCSKFKKYHIGIIGVYG